jgi:hypothetical protein
MGRKRKFNIGDVVRVKGLKNTHGKVTFVRREDGINKFKVKEKSGISRFFNERSLEKFKAKPLTKQIKKIGVKKI